jgi:hypothetical protein
LLCNLSRVGQGRSKGGCGGGGAGTGSRLWGQCISSNVHPRPQVRQGWDRLRDLSFGDNERYVFWWVDKFSGIVVSNGVSYGGRVAESRNSKVFFEFIAIKAWTVSDGAI